MISDWSQGWPWNKHIWLHNMLILCWWGTTETRTKQDYELPNIKRLQTYSNVWPIFWNVMVILKLLYINVTFENGAPFRSHVMSNKIIISCIEWPFWEGRDLNEPLLVFLSQYFTLEFNHIGIVSQVENIAFCPINIIIA